MNKKWMIVVLGLTLVATACGSHGLTDKQQEQKKTDEQALDPKERKAILGKLDPKIVEAENAFGLRIHQALSKLETGENVLISPYSLSTGLALAYNGSAGETAQQMQTVLGWNDMGLKQVNAANSQLRSILEHGGGVTLNIANSVWIQNDFVMKESYLNTVKDGYGAEVKATDLGQQESINIMNNWVSEKTNGMIKEVYSKPQDAKAILINAVYFNGGWMDEFNPQLTEDKDFTLADGTVKKVPMMKQEQGFGYKESDKWQAVRLPYGDGRMHMLVVVPSKDSSLEELHKQLWQDPSVWRSDYEFETIKLELPRFKAELSDKLSEKLIDILKNAGMKNAFLQEKADFSAMAETPLYIRSIGHKVVVDVNEEGTEAAAVTSIAMPTGAPEPTKPVVMTVDRPFFFAIEDRDTGAFLFMGSIMNP
ncbi:serpin family protein [Paenibacillus sp. EC2-1]|uniref:serpin family protein n=1 Tax=Paenibacillus sp. EC2-1 TaxID=3388665 RepID=UPI003BEF2678